MLKEMRHDPPEDTSVLQPLVSLILLMKTKTNSKSTVSFLQVSQGTVAAVIILTDCRTCASKVTAEIL